MFLGSCSSQLCAPRAIRNNRRPRDFGAECIDWLACRLHPGALNQAIFSPTGVSVGIGFAGPSRTAMEDVVLGLALSPLPEVMQRQLGLDPGTQAAVVQRVEPGGPAAEAGMLQGDVNVQVDDRPLAGPGDVSTAWRTAREEERPLLMRILRNGNPLFVAIEPVG